MLLALLTSLTAAHPPGNTPATRTGESPRSVSPSPASPRTKHVWRLTQRFRAQKTESGPFICRGEHSTLLTFKTCHSIRVSVSVTSRWKMSVTLTALKSGVLISGFCCVWAVGERSKVMLRIYSILTLLFLQYVNCAYYAKGPYAWNIWMLREILHPTMQCSNEWSRNYLQLWVLK